MNDQLKTLTVMVFIGIALCAILMLLTNPTEVLSEPPINQCGLDMGC